MVTWPQQINLNSLIHIYIKEVRTVILLFCFIAGMIFGQHILPVLDGIFGWFLTWVEAKKTRQTDIVNQLNIKMRIDNFNSDKPMNKIGFNTTNCEEEDE